MLYSVQCFLLLGLKATKRTTNSHVKSLKKCLKMPKNPLIEDEQTAQWAKEKVQKYKQQSIKHTHKTKDRVDIQIRGWDRHNIVASLNHLMKPQPLYSIQCNLYNLNIIGTNVIFYLFHLLV